MDAAKSSRFRLPTRPIACKSGLGAGDYRRVEAGNGIGFGSVCLICRHGNPPRGPSLFLGRIPRFAIWLVLPLLSPPVPGSYRVLPVHYRQGQDKSRIKVCVNLRGDCNTPDRVGGRSAKYKTNTVRIKNIFTTNTWST